MISLLGLMVPIILIRKWCNKDEWIFKHRNNDENNLEESKLSLACKWFLAYVQYLIWYIELG